MENLASTGIRSPDSPGRSVSLYRLRVSRPDVSRVNFNIIINLTTPLGGVFPNNWPRAAGKLHKPKVTEIYLTSTTLAEMVASN